MTQQELKSVIRRGEGSVLEAKSARGGFPDSFWETYSSFANTDGGVIVLGVKESQDHNTLVVEGLADVQKTKRDLWNMLNNRQKVNRNILTNAMAHEEVIEEKMVLVVDVPRAERTARPVYKGQDPFLGTYRRYNDGDHLCSAEVVGAMMRDASQMPMDAQTIDNMDISVFCQDSVESYFRLFKNSNPNHLWSKLPLDMFLRRIRAVDVGADGQYHPTEAGLLMFGYEYEITRRFPQYFLDYQEDRQMYGMTRWKDRIVSSSGDWSGNLFDFVFKVLHRLQEDLKRPFVMRGVQRIDDTPIHKLLREATINCLVHADYNGRQGVVITKGEDGFVFANPGRMRIPIAEAVGGGISDPRNSTLLKMFSFIRFGERAGSGLSGIIFLWEKVFHTSATIVEKDSEVDRTILTLPFNGHEQDIEAMLQFYDDPTEYSVKDFITEKEEESGEKTSEEFGINLEEFGIKAQKFGKNLEKFGINPKDFELKFGINAEKFGINAEKFGEKAIAIISIIILKSDISAKSLSDIFEVTPRTIEKILQKLKMNNILRRVGSRKTGHWEVMN